MAKILLVEDDNNLREIYEARLQAEGYSIVSAHDGEEALVVAKSEKPDLIISDVMMPKISGFEMLDILRNTDALKDVKVIMLTALGQSDDQQRANKLGADRYLVKSQVTLEDIVNVANELLKGAAPAPAGATPGEPSSAPAPNTFSSTPSPAPAPTAPPEPVATAPAPQPVASEPASSPPASVPVTSVPPAAAATSTAPDLAEPANEEQQEVKSQIEDFITNQSNSTPAAAVPTPATDNGTAVTTPAASPLDTGEPMLTPEDDTNKEEAAYSPQPAGKKVIEPLADSETKPDINELLEEEKAREIVESGVKADDSTPPTMSAADTAPTPSEPVIAPSNTEPVKENVDPNSSIAL